MTILRRAPFAAALLFAFFALFTSDDDAFADEFDALDALRTAPIAEKYAQAVYYPPPTYYYAYPPLYVAPPTYVYSTPIGPPVQVWFP